MGTEETIVRGVDSSAIDKAKMISNMRTTEETLNTGISTRQSMER
jgi:hypothetical protein